MNDHQYIQYYTQLILKSLKEGLTIAEHEQLEEWLAQSEENRVYYEQLQQEEHLEAEMEFFSSIDSDRAFDRLKQQLHPSEEEDKVQRVWWKPYVAAAAILAILLLSWGMFGNLLSISENPVHKPLLSEDIAPGTDKAILVLPDGEQIVLDAAHEGTLKEDDGVTVAKKVNQVIFNVQKDFAATGGAKMNRVFVPKGGKYQVVLADGTKVWLNSASSLEFPSNFTGTSRRVSLKGEGYFEVAHNPDNPFIVQAEDTEVKVLGTHFNINTYDNEPVGKTTLLEGSVQVAYIGQQKIISPGEQLLSADGLPVKTIDTRQVVAWKEGLLCLRVLGLMIF